LGGNRGEGPRVDTADQRAKFARSQRVTGRAGTTWETNKREGKTGAGCNRGAEGKKARGGKDDGSEINQKRKSKFKVWGN